MVTSEIRLTCFNFNLLALTIEYIEKARRATLVLEYSGWFMVGLLTHFVPISYHLLFLKPPKNRIQVKF